MTQDDWEYVQHKMENEGFHYCFECYSDFNEIIDEEFHRLRKEYLIAAKLLENYVNDKASIEDE